jgi:hypothetical protein
VWEYPEIAKYIVQSREHPEMWDVYIELGRIYTRCKEYRQQRKVSRRRREMLHRQTEDLRNKMIGS